MGATGGAEPAAFRAQQDLRGGLPGRHPRVQSPDQCAVWPDGCAYVADYGAVRDFGRSDPDAGFKNGADAALVQIPGTGVICKICPN
jgi:hypothetical protein